MPSLKTPLVNKNPNLISASMSSNSLHTRSRAKKGGSQANDTIDDGTRTAFETLIPPALSSTNPMKRKRDGQDGNNEEKENDSDDDTVIVLASPTSSPTRKASRLSKRVRTTLPEVHSSQLTSLAFSVFALTRFLPFRKKDIMAMATTKSTTLTGLDDQPLDEEEIPDEMKQNATRRVIQRTLRHTLKRTPLDEAIATRPARLM